MAKRHFIEHVLSAEDRDAISRAIHRAEQHTSGEIKVVVRERRHFSEKRLSLEKLAVKEFRHVRLSKTRDRTGILFFLLPAERKFHLVADEGIHRQVPDGTWARIADSMSTEFKKGRYREGIIRGVEEVGAIFSKGFPKSPSDRNEISDKVIVE